MSSNRSAACGQCEMCQIENYELCQRFHPHPDQVKLARSLHKLRTMRANMVLATRHIDQMTQDVERLAERCNRRYNEGHTHRAERHPVS